MNILQTIMIMYKLKKKGLIEKNEKGLWVMTEKGKEYEED